MLPKEGVRPQLIPAHETLCISPSQAKLLHECMSENQSIDPVKLYPYDYQAIEPIHLFDLLQEEEDTAIEVSPYEALVIQEASKIGVLEDLPSPVPWQDLLSPDQMPQKIPTTPCKTDKLLRGLRAKVNVQDMDQWSVFTENLRYTVNDTPAPGFDTQEQGCLDFSSERTHRLDGAKDISMAPLDFQYMQQVNLWIDTKA